MPNILDNKFLLKDYESFLAKRGFLSQVKIEKDKFSLCPEIWDTLKKCFDVFVSGSFAECRFDAVRKDLKEEANIYIKNAGHDIDSVDVFVKANEIFSEVKIVKKTEYGENTLFIDGGYLQPSDREGVLNAAITKWDWARWLADVNSPIYSENFVDAYWYDYCSMLARETACLDYVIGTGQTDIEKAIIEFLV